MLLIYYDSVSSTKNTLLKNNFYIKKVLFLKHGKKENSTVLDCKKLMPGYYRFFFQMSFLELCNIVKETPLVK